MQFVKQKHDEPNVFCVQILRFKKVIPSLIFIIEYHFLACEVNMTFFSCITIFTSIVNRTGVIVMSNLVINAIIWYGKTPIVL